MSPSKQKSKVYVIGIGMTKFVKPGSVPNWDYPDMVKEAVDKALSDAKLQYRDVEQATVGYIYGGTCCGQRALYEIGITGIPIYNVNNACASGSTVVYLSKLCIEGGHANVVLAVGFEKMKGGSLESMENNDDRTHALERHIDIISSTYGLLPVPVMAQMNQREHFAKIAQKNHKHSVNNPNSQFQKEYSLGEILNARIIHDVMGLLECSPTSDGAAAVILCSEHFLKKSPHLFKQAVEIIGAELGTDEPSVFAERSNLKMIGFDMIQKLSNRLYQRTNLTPNDVQVIELHDCFAPNELISYEALGLCPVGKSFLCKGGEIVDKGDNTYGGKWVINPSGGLISKGHPIGATGVAQVVELSLQLRGLAGARQVPNCKVALQHNIGIGGAGMVALYRLAEPSSTVVSDLKETDLPQKINSSFRFILTGPDDAVKKWVVDCKVTPPTVIEMGEGNVDVEMTMKDSDFVKIVAGNCDLISDDDGDSGEIDEEDSDDGSDEDEKAMEMMKVMKVMKMLKIRNKANENFYFDYMSQSPYKTHEDCYDQREPTFWCRLDHLPALNYHGRNRILFIPAENWFQICIRIFDDMFIKVSNFNSIENFAIFKDVGCYYNNVNYTKKTFIEEMITENTGVFLVAIFSLAIFKDSVGLECYICDDENLDENGECHRQFHYDCNNYAKNFQPTEAIFVEQCENE
ncbi:Non-specific lipid-transfer protein [Dirofilaria immitis]|nr:Non-specific lipid-transfer protein [Dirofilaria immitis]